MNIKSFLKDSIEGKISLPQQEKFLRAKMKPTPTELASVANFLIKQMPKRVKLPKAIDICGTGGSGLPRINTSTISAFVLASLGVKIAKHGNKAASGRFGSFDLLEKLGIDFENDFNKPNLAFLYARKFHPVMKHFAAVRTKIGKPTFFNILGPLISPANVKYQIIGTAFKDKMLTMAKTCRLLKKKRVFIVCGEDGLDEITLTGKTHIVELKNGKISQYTISPEDFGISPSTFDEIKGGDPKFNTKITLDILKGKCATRHLDLVLINCALALKMYGKVRTLRDGYKMAKRAVRSGKTYSKYRQYSLPASERDFYRTLKSGGISVIAEIKKKSPSMGLICKGKFSPKDIARNYEQQGAAAISVLCNKELFDGDVKFMREAKKATTHTPILCKDFIRTEEQIYKAREYGADAILLIASDLSQYKLQKFTIIAKELNMDVLLEVHTLEELKKALKTSAKIIGINNRNLKTFKIDLKTTAKIAKHIPKSKVIVSESGMHTRKDITSLPKNVNAVLVGTSLMKGAKVSDLADKKLKACGVRTVKMAKYCEKAGVDFIGLNFVPSSKRKISIKKGKEICHQVDFIQKVGVFQNQSLSFIEKISDNLDFIQLSGDESVQFIKQLSKPVIKTIKDPKEAEKYIQHVAYILIDGPEPGSGKPADLKKLKNFKHPFLLAGGINAKNLKEACKLNPLGVDLASGIETKGKVDLRKIKQIHNQLRSC
jgi:anthranilate phosphoribosyltransferase